MIFSRSNKQKQLIEVFNETIEHLSKADDISWGGMSAAEVVMDLKISIEELETGKKLDKNYLKTHYAPTGLIQEHSIEHNWSKEYMELASKFDKLIGR